jgi:hypothetical protein
MLFKEVITIYTEDHMKHVTIICVQNEELLNVKARNTLVGIVTIWFKGLIIFTFSETVSVLKLRIYVTAFSTGSLKNKLG